jgi:hypothetical protein
MKQSHLLSFFMPMYLFLKSAAKPPTRRNRSNLGMTGRMLPPQDSALHTYKRRKLPCLKGTKHG